MILMASETQISMEFNGVKSCDKFSTEEDEARLRKKLLEKRQQSREIKRHDGSDEEEMFTIQPDFQKKKKGTVTKISKEKVVEKKPIIEKPKERATRKPIEWRSTTEHDRSKSFKSKENVRRDYLPNLKHYRSYSPTVKRKSETKKDDFKNVDKDRSLRKEDDRRETSHRYHKHYSLKISDTKLTYKTETGEKDEVRKEKEEQAKNVILMANQDQSKLESLKLNDNKQSLTEKLSQDEKIEKTFDIENDQIFPTVSTVFSSPSETPSFPSSSTSPESTQSKRSKKRRCSISSNESDFDNYENFQNGERNKFSEHKRKKNKATSEESSKNSVPNSTEEHLLVSPASNKTTEEMDYENTSVRDYKKYSKFESSSESDEFCEIEENEISLDYKEELEIKEDELNLRELEQKEFEELTNEEKELLPIETLSKMEENYQKKIISMLPVYYPGISGCRRIVEFENLNRIEEGTFGVVYRAIEKKTDEVVALKRLKMENEKEGFPITSLREINMLLKCGTHPNIVNLREIVVGESFDRIYLVMEYVDHDLKTLMETMSKKSRKFPIGQVKTLMHQFLSGVEHLHQEYVIHRDLKTSNLLLTQNGILKIGDFGLAREFGDPIKPYTSVVVTLWYRSPELLLGCKEYSTAVDMWSVGCIFGELLKFQPMFPGQGEADQLKKIFKEIGTPNETIWPGFNDLPRKKNFTFNESPVNQLKKTFAPILSSESGLELLNRLLAPCPRKRLLSSEALKSLWFKEEPLPLDPSLFPSWPSKSDYLSRDKSKANLIGKSSKSENLNCFNKPNAEQLKLMQELNVDASHATRDGFSLKFDVSKF